MTSRQVQGKKIFVIHHSKNRICLSFFAIQKDIIHFLIPFVVAAKNLPFSRDFMSSPSLSLFDSLSRSSHISSSLSVEWRRVINQHVVDEKSWQIKRLTIHTHKRERSHVGARVNEQEWLSSLHLIDEWMVFLWYFEYSTSRHHRSI